jgi:hypothetical protein
LTTNDIAGVTIIRERAIAMLEAGDTAFAGDIAQLPDRVGVTIAMREAAHTTRLFFTASAATQHAIAAKVACFVRFGETRQAL